MTGPGRVSSPKDALGRFRAGGVVHAAWLAWYGRPMWPWRWVCWLNRKHEPWGNGRRSYCLYCGKDMP